MEEKDFSVIILSESADYLVEIEDQIERKEKGVELIDPYIFNENEQAQLVRAEKIFIPYNSIETIQYGDFKQETV
ncbi:MAG: hypothetical protein ABEJ95_00305 [Candidatus Nanohalobium sp.]